jgi:hypothetical protein
MSAVISYSAVLVTGRLSGYMLQVSVDLLATVWTTLAGGVSRVYEQGGQGHCGIPKNGHDQQMLKDR